MNMLRREFCGSVSRLSGGFAGVLFGVGLGVVVCEGGGWLELLGTVKIIVFKN